MKHLDIRPDFCFVDDVEETEHVRTAEARAETLSWFMTELMPALDKDARIRVVATPLDREALPASLAKQPGWTTLVPKHKAARRRPYFGLRPSPLA